LSSIHEFNPLYFFSSVEAEDVVEDVVDVAVVVLPLSVGEEEEGSVMKI
jgi:hypothetical protein